MLDIGTHYSPTKGIQSMTHVIVKDECIQCGACESECAKGAIFTDGDTYQIDAAKCEDCGDCVDVCPTGSISKA
jgi:ferredoxin